MMNQQHPTRETATERVFHEVRQAILSIAIAGIMGAFIGIVGTEAMAAALARSLPGGPAHIAALAIGLLLGYAAIATTAIWALAHGISQTLGVIAGDLERVSERVVHELETRAGAQARPMGVAPLPPLNAGRGAAWALSPVTSGVLVGMAEASPPVAAVPASPAESTSAPLVLVER